MRKQAVSLRNLQRPIGSGSINAQSQSLQDHKLFTYLTTYHPAKEADMLPARFPGAQKWSSYHCHLHTGNNLVTCAGAVWWTCICVDISAFSFLFKALSPQSPSQIIGSLSKLIAASRSRAGAVFPACSAQDLTLESGSTTESYRTRRPLKSGHVLLNTVVPGAAACVPWTWGYMLKFCLALAHLAGMQQETEYFLFFPLWMRHSKLINDVKGRVG